MSAIGRRDLLLALAALGSGLAGAASAAAADPLAGIDAAAAAKVGAAWRAAHPGATAKALEKRLFPDGRTDARALARLQAAVRSDFREGRVFMYRGWRLSDTEGALMALLAG